jgi:ATP-binding cassette subfamily E protein 1
VIKPQYVDHIPKAVRGNVLTALTARDERKNLHTLLVDLELEQVTGTVSDEEMNMKATQM